MNEGRFFVVFDFGVGEPKFLMDALGLRARVFNTADEATKAAKATIEASLYRFMVIDLEESKCLEESK